MNAILKEAKKLIEQGNISQALDFISNEAKASGMRDLSEKAQRLLTDFNYMLNYYMTGAQDPTRQEMLARIYDGTYSILDCMAARTENGVERLNRISSIDLSDTQDLFDTIENNFPSNNEDRNSIQEIIMDETNPLYLRAMVLSALTMNLLKYFDNEKFESLYTYTLEDQPLIIRQRAWVAIVLVAMAHDHRISTQPRLVEQLRFICEEGVNIDGLNTLLTIQIALYQCLEAQTARRILKEEITPDIEKSLSEMKDDQNPQWEEKLEQTGIQDKLREFADLQKNGIDIMLDGFAHMTHLNFFAHRSNWFMPFTLDHPEVESRLKEQDKKSQYIKVLYKAGNMCATDKFSNMLMLNYLPEEQFKQVEETMKANDVKFENIIEASPKEEIINYLHDLYRFYYIYKTTKKAYNPFARNLYFGKYECLRSVSEDSETKHMISEFLLKHKRYADARTVFKEIVDSEVSEENLQKYAYCIMKYDPDDTSYGDILALCNNYFPGNKWTIKHYANALMNEMNYHSAEIILREACNAFQDDVNFPLSLAKCLITQERYEEAMKYLYKADLLKENSTRTIRHMAWCSFVLGNKEQSERYISQVLGDPNAKSADWINGGHIALLCNNIDLAMERYLNAEPDDVLFAFIDDADKMLKAGISQEVITLTHEVLNRKINE